MRLLFLAAALVAVLATAAHGAPDRADATKVRRGTGTLVLRGWTGRRGVWNKLCATQCRPAPFVGPVQRPNKYICAHVASILCPPGRLGALHSPTLRIGVRQRSAAYVALA